MKFSVENTDMSKGLAIAGRAVSPKNSIPVLECIHITAKDEQLILRTSDTEMNIITKIPAHVSIPGEVLVPLKTLSDLVRTYPNEKIFFLVDENYSISINCAKSDVVILGRDPLEFPEITEVSDAVFSDIDSEVFKNLIRETAFACAPLVSINPVLTGVNIEYENDTLDFTALDGYKLASRNEKAKTTTAEIQSAIVPGRILNEILKIISMYSQDVRFAITPKKFVVQVEDTQIQSNLLNGPYINYRSLIPSQVNTIVKADRQSLLTSVERASLITAEQHNSLIKMVFTEDIVTISSNSDIGNITEEVEINMSGEELKIAFNARYIIEILKNIRDEHIVMEFKDRSGACLIKPVDNDKYLYLVMPVRYTE